MAASKRLTLSLTFQPERVLRVLWAVLICLAAAGALSQVLLRHVLGHDTVFGLTKRVDLGAEANLPTWFTSATLLLDALLVWTIASVKKRAGDIFARHWTGLACLFLYLSIDEAATLHELIGEWVGMLLDVRGILNYAWVVPASGAVALITLVYWQFVWSLPRRVCQLVVAAAALYVGGSIGAESVEGYLAYSGLRQSVTFTWLVTFEETAEMIGVLLFMKGMLGYQQWLAAAADKQPSIRSEIRANRSA